MELLVHVSAASSKKDDDRFKRLARSYSDFEVINTTLVQSHEGLVSPEICIPGTDLISTASGKLDASSWSPSKFLDDTQLARTALESQFLTSSLRQEQHDLDTVSERYKGTRTADE